MADRSISVTAPGSTANLGPGFDVLGLAVDLRAQVGLGTVPDGAHMLDEFHPGTIAYRRIGGSGRELWSRSRLPMGRGLGYSGAVRTAGAMLALVETDGPEAAADLSCRSTVMSVVSELEGHGDNAAASIYGGLVIASSDNSVVKVPLALDAVLLVWIPDSTTSTDHSRASLEQMVPRVDAVANLASIAGLIVGCMSGDLTALRSGCIDRLHQPARLASVPRSAEVLQQLLERGALAAWLSGSGPTVAAFVGRHDVDDIGSTIGDGTVRVLEIDSVGVSASVPV